MWDPEDILWRWQLALLMALALGLNSRGRSS